MARSKLHDLIEMAQEPSSERRRELLRGVTDLFFASDEAIGWIGWSCESLRVGELAAEIQSADEAEDLTERRPLGRPQLGGQRELRRLGQHLTRANPSAVGGRQQKYSMGHGSA